MFQLHTFYFKLDAPAMKLTAYKATYNKFEF